MSDMQKNMTAKRATSLTLVDYCILANCVLTGAILWAERPQLLLARQAWWESRC